MTFLVLLLLSCARPCLAQTAPEELPPAAPAPRPAAHPLAAKARALYFTGDVAKSADAFDAAVKVSSGDWKAWADGAIAWGEAGFPDKAVTWFRRAVSLNDVADLRAALGWSLLRAAEPEAAQTEFERALALRPDSVWALIGAGRARLALGAPKEAAEALSRAAQAQAAPGQSLANYYLGTTYEALGDESAAVDAYKRSVGADSYFNEGRGILARAYLRQRRYNEAWRQLQKLIEADPGSKLARAMLGKVRPLLTAHAPDAGVAPAASATIAPAAAHETEPWGDKIPALRVSVSSTAMGKPRARVAATVHGSGEWKALDPKSGRALVSAGAGESWTLRLIPANRKKKKSRARLELRAADGRVAAVPGDAVLIKPADAKSSALTIEDDPGHASRAFRGELELSLTNLRRAIRIVNIVGLEDYTHGVVSAEMPERSPLEALKAQAVVARTHAYFIKTVTKRHRKDGYDLCDEQHCQVYGGLRAETERTRAVVNETRGQIAVYAGKPAHVIYSSHCGGWTQSGADLGWGNLPYWRGVSDADPTEDFPASPLDLRRSLSEWPRGFDRPSDYVHASHARWGRVIPAKDLEEKLNRKFKIGKLLGLRVLRRGPSGHVEALLIIGSKRNRKLTDELDIRGLLGVGSLRSSLFVIDAEYRKEYPPAKAASRKKKAPKPRPVLLPETFVFRGGGWGHAVGLCQSGAMGRAEAGQGFAAIVRAYFTGVEIGKLDY